MTAIPNTPTLARTRGLRIGRPGASTLLWSAQVLLGGLFIFAGGFKLIMPASDLGENTALPVTFMRFIGVCEFLGGMALVLPGVVRSARPLAPVAAAGLVIIMGGAVTVSAIEVGLAAAALPLLVGIALAAVGRGRRSWING
jgi:peptidoglycan/LPS O-acetylase OafA/YrhL